MELGLAGENLIKSYEGFPVNGDGNPVGYLDSGGVPTIGWGHTGSIDGVAVYVGMVISKAKAQELFDSDVASACNTINYSVTVPLTQAQFDALVSFCFNIGGSQFKSSTLLKKLNAGDYAGASLEFDRWVFDNGVKLNGLVDRRNAEENLFNSESYPTTPDPTPEEPEPMPAPNPEPNPDDPPPYARPDGEVYNDILTSSYNVNQLSNVEKLALKTLSYGDNVKMRFTFNRRKNEIGTTFTGKRLTFDNKDYIINSVNTKGFVVLSYGSFNLCDKTINPKYILI